MKSFKRNGAKLGRIIDRCGMADAGGGGPGRPPRSAGETSLCEPLEPRVLLSSGDLDATFGVARHSAGGGPGAVFTDFIGSTRDGAEGIIAVQGDGKIVVAGWSEGAGADFAVARYNSNGTLDGGFGSGGKVTVDFGSRWDYATALAIGPDGKIVVAGQSWDASFSSSDFGVVRLKASGALDTAFDGDGKVLFNTGSAFDMAQGVAVDSSGRVVVVGSVTTGGGDTDFAVVRLTAGGSSDTSFGVGGVVTTDFASTLGAFSPTNDYAQDVVLGAGGTILVGGGAVDTSGGSLQYFALARYDSAGALDGTFGSGGTVATHVETFVGDTGISVFGLAVDGAGRIVAAGAAGSAGIGANAPGFGVARYTSGGALDAGFGAGGIVVTSPSEPGYLSSGAWDVAVDTSNRVVVAGGASDGALSQFALTRYNSDGTLDTSFDGDGRVLTAFGTSGHSEALGVAIDGGGKIIAAGITGDFGRKNDFAMARYTAAGALDTSFDADGRKTTGFSGGSFQQGVTFGHTLAVQGDGKIVLAGITYNDDAGFALGFARYKTDGRLDSSFGSGGRVSYHFGAVPWFDLPTAIIVRSDGKIVVGGQTSDSFGMRRGLVARLNSNGSLDTSFGTGGWIATQYAASGAGEDYISDIALDSSGRILAAGYATDSFGTHSVVARYKSTGAIDTAFDGDGMIFGSGDISTDYLPQAVGVDSSGKIVVAGIQYGGATLYDATLRRYTSAGAADLTFDGDGAVTTDLGPSAGTNDLVTDMVFDGAGRIVIVGQSADLFMGTSTAVVVRYATNGSLDGAFGSGGIARANPASPTDTITSVAVDASGRLVVVGLTSQFAGPGQDIFIARFSASGALDTGFGTGGAKVLDFRGGADQPMGVALDSKGRIVIGGWTDDGNLQNPDFVVARFLPEDVSVVSVDVTRDLHGVIIQFDNDFLDPAQAENKANYRLIAANGDANHDGDPFNDGDEQVVSIYCASFDSCRNTVSLSTCTVLFEDVFRLVIDGDGTSSDGTPGLGLRAGDSTTDLNMESLSLAEGLLTRVEDLGGMGSRIGRTLIERMEDAVTLLGDEVDHDRGVISLLKSFITGVNQWYDRGGISRHDRDSLIDDANQIILGIRLTD